MARGTRTDGRIVSLATAPSAPSLPPTESITALFERTYRLFRISGIDVRITPSWLLIAFLFVIGFFPRFGDYGTATALALAVGGALLFFTSILVHELAHGLEAKRRGIDVAGITLFLFGGVTEMRMEAERPRDEFAVAAIGPYVSLVVAALLGLTVTAIEFFEVEALDPVAEIAGTIGWLNVLLAAFNLIPGAPLDGGRVLRAGVWAVTKNRARALRLASRFGQGVALSLIPLAWLVWEQIFGRPPQLFDLAWFAFIGWFMWNAASAEIRQADLHDAMGGRTVGDLAVPDLPTLSRDRSLDSVGAAFAAGPHVDRILPVTDGDGRLVGVLRMEDVEEVAAPDRPFRTVGETQRGLESLPSVSSDATIVQLLRSLGDGAAAVVERRDGTAVRLLSQPQVALVLRDLRSQA